MSAASSSNPACCSICLYPCVVGSNKSATVTLICGHQFHLSCIGCQFNMKGKMECPLCRVTEDSEWRYCTAGITETPPLWETDEEMENDDQEFEGLGSDVVPEISVDDQAEIFQQINDELARVASTIEENNFVSSVLAENEQPIWLMEEDPFLVQNHFQDAFPGDFQFQDPFPVPNNFQEPFPAMNDSAEGVQLSAPMTMDPTLDFIQEVNTPPIGPGSSEVPRIDSSENARETESLPPPPKKE